MARSLILAPDPPHDRAFARITVAAAAEDGDDATLCQLPQGGQHVLQGIAGMGIVHKQRDPAIVVHPLHAPRHGGMPFDAGTDRLQRQVQGDAGGHRRQDIGEVEAPQQTRGNIRSPEGSTSLALMPATLQRDLLGPHIALQFRSR